MSSSPRAYTWQDINKLTKKDIAALIRQQQDRWPHRSFNASKVKLGTMKEALLDPANGFTMAQASVQPTDEVDSEPLHTIIHLFIEDRRSNPPRRSAVDMNVRPTDVQELESEGGVVHSISAKQVTVELQKSFSALSGSFKLACPHYLNKDYLEYFVCCNDGRLEASVFRPSILRVSSSSIHIIVEKFEAPWSAPSENEPPQELPKLKKQKRPSSARHLDSVIEWLQQKAYQQSGYQIFADSQHHILQNSEIVAVWKFAAEFHDVYYQARCDITKTRITKSSIQSCLGVGETWLTEALVGHRLVKIYGPGGSHSAQGVISELAVTRAPPCGRGALLTFLRDWEVAHPCTAL